MPGSSQEVSEAAREPVGSGARSSLDTRPVSWLVRAMGSLGRHPGTRAEAGKGLVMEGVEGFLLAALAMVTLSPVCPGMSAEEVAKRCVRATPSGART